VVKLHDRVIVSCLHFLKGILKLFLNLDGLSFPQPGLLVLLIVKFLGQRVTFDNLLSHEFLHALCDFYLAILHVFLLLDNFHVLNFGTQIVSLGILLLVDQVVENSAVVQQFGARLVNGGQ